MNVVQNIFLIKCMIKNGNQFAYQASEKYLLKSIGADANNINVDQ